MRAPEGVPRAVTVNLRPTGNAPILKVTKFRVSADKPFASIIAFLRKQLHSKPTDSLVTPRPSARPPADDAGAPVCLLQHGLRAKSGRNGLRPLSGARARGRGIRLTETALPVLLRERRAAPQLRHHRRLGLTRPAAGESVSQLCTIRALCLDAARRSQKLKRVPLSRSLVRALPVPPWR